MPSSNVYAVDSTASESTESFSRLSIIFAGNGRLDAPVLLELGRYPDGTAMLREVTDELEERGISIADTDEARDNRIMSDAIDSVSWRTKRLPTPCH